MDKIPLLAPKEFDEYSPEEFREYIKSIRRENQAESASKYVDGISISNSKKLIIRVTKKDPFSQLELDQLALEYKLDKAFLEESFLKRKIPFLDSEGNLVLKKPKERKKKDDPTKPRRKKGNASDSSSSIGQEANQNQLQQPLDPSILHEESPIQAAPEPKLEGSI